MTNKEKFLSGQPFRVVNDKMIMPQVFRYVPEQHNITADGEHYYLVTDVKNCWVFGLRQAFLSMDKVFVGFEEMTFIEPTEKP